MSARERRCDTRSLQILRLLDSFIKTDYRDPEVLIYQIKWSWFLHPCSRMHFIPNNIQPEMRFGLLQIQSELIKQKLAGPNRAEYQPVHAASGNCGHKIEGMISVSGRAPESER